MNDSEVLFSVDEGSPDGDYGVITEYTVVDSKIVILDQRIISSNKKERML
jgi:hypothetical protein